MDLRVLRGLNSRVNGVLCIYLVSDRSYLPRTVYLSNRSARNTQGRDTRRYAGQKA